MRRIWVNAEELNGANFELIGDSYHHAVLVSRLQKNEEFEIVSGSSIALRARITEIKKKTALVEVFGQRNLPTLKKPYVHLAVALPKWSTLEWIVEKCVELGVKSVQPLFSDFSFTRSPKDFSEQKIARLNKIIQSATEQSGRGELLKLLPAITLKDFIENINRNPEIRGLFAYEGVTQQDIQSALKEQKKTLTEDIWAIVGSEGGFSETEVQFMQNAKLPPLTMGDQILRVDTACFSMISVIKYELGLMTR